MHLQQIEERKYREEIVTTATCLFEVGIVFYQKDLEKLYRRFRHVEGSWIVECNTDEAANQDQSPPKKVQKGPSSSRKRE